MQNTYNIIVSLLWFALCATVVNAQSGITNDGAAIHITQGSFLRVDGSQGNINNKNAGSCTGKIENSGVINLTGKWFNNGQFISDEGMVIFSGENTFITGSAISEFNKVYLNKNASSNIVRLDADIIVNGTLTMTSGDIFLNNNTIDLKTTGKINSETNSNKIYDNYASGTGKITSNRINLTPAAGESFGNLGIVITSDQNFGNTSISRKHNQQTSTDPAGSSIYRYFDITTQSTNDLNATMQFQYFEDEIPAGMNEADFALYKSVDAGITWSNQGGTVADALNYIEQTGIKQFCRYTVSDMNVSPLPVDLIDFVATRNNATVMLNWTTLAEINNRGFEIERSKNLNTWERIGFVNGLGNSNTRYSYSFNDLLNDINADVSALYYRLKQIDFDGRYKYTEIRSVMLDIKDNESGIAMYPNPATDAVYIICNPFEKEWRAQILNTNGMLLKSFALTGSSLILVSDLPKGIYQVVLSDEITGTKIIKKLIVI